MISDEEGKDRWVEGPGEYPVAGLAEPVRARSRTFVPSRVDYNPYLLSTGYKASLQAMPEPPQSAMLRGDWTASRVDHAFQLIPTAWVEKAQARWTAATPGPMSALGVDVAQGGADATVLAPRHGKWFAPLKVVRGVDTKDGPAVAGLVFAHMRDGCAIAVDMGGGWGGSAYDHLRREIGNRVDAVVPAARSTKRTRDGKLEFVNKRAELWWTFREALDPQTGSDLALPPDPALVADLIAPRWKLTPRGIQVELKEEIRKRLGRSPDRGDAVVMAWGFGPDGAAGPAFHRLRQMQANVGYTSAKPWASKDQRAQREAPR